MAFVFPQKVRFQHCDPAGIVFYPRYFEMLNATVEEWFATRLGHSFADIHGGMRAGVPTAALSAEFQAPSRLGETLDFALALTGVGRASCALRVAATCEGAPRVGFASTLVWIGMDDGRPRPWPPALRERLMREIETKGDEA
jgi:4-hydroxybenzoyl-CoA thioesterase